MTLIKEMKLRDFICKEDLFNHVVMCVGQKNVGTTNRHFVLAWFDEFCWLEYSVKADKAFCLWCYLCRNHVDKQCRSDTFVTDGFSNWNKKNRFSVHEGDVNSFHNRARLKCEDLMKPKQSITVALNKQYDIEKQEYRIHLQSSIDVVRYVMHNTLPFRGHDESENSIYRGIFLETLKLVVSKDEDAHKAMIKVPKKCKLTSPDIQKHIVDCFAKEILTSIFREIGNEKI
ncbi:uncharacterized protein [Rutidosis leptorrhynchoides]|uniref:uncharacterized protein n=1 Tax=Rutidosis leptorrhynchoides TaxID=125765 RepID=UPI003A9A389D